MKLLLATLWHGLRPKPIVLRLDSSLYRWARLLCQWFEEMSPAISQRAGFTYDMGWVNELDQEDPDITEGL